MTRAMFDGYLNLVPDLRMGEGAKAGHVTIVLENLRFTFDGGFEGENGSLEDHPMHLRWESGPRLYYDEELRSTGLEAVEEFDRLSGAEKLTNVKLSDL